MHETKPKINERATEKSERPPRASRRHRLTVSKKTRETTFISKSRSVCKLIAARQRCGGGGRGQLDESDVFGIADWEYAM